MGSASIYSFPDKAILGVTSGISHRLECTGMRAVTFRYPPHTRTFLLAHFWLRHRRQAETWITRRYGRRISFKSDSIGRDTQYEESNVRAIFPTHNPTHNSRSLVGLTSILAVPCCKTDNRSAVALEEEAIQYGCCPQLLLPVCSHTSRASPLIVRYQSSELRRSGMQFIGSHKSRRRPGSCRKLQSSSSLSNL